MKWWTFSNILVLKHKLALVISLPAGVVTVAMLQHPSPQALNGVSCRNSARQGGLGTHFYREQVAAVYLCTKLECVNVHFVNHSHFLTPHSNVDNGCVLVCPSVKILVVPVESVLLVPLFVLNMISLRMFDYIWRWWLERFAVWESVTLFFCSTFQVINLGSPPFSWRWPLKLQHHLSFWAS